MRIYKRLLCLIFTNFFLSCSQPDVEFIEVDRPVTVEVPVLIEVPVTVEVPIVVEPVETLEVPVLIEPDKESIPPEHDFSGVYVVLRDQERFPGAGCQINVHHLTSLEPFDELIFELHCIIGPPSYNQGFASDTILFESDFNRVAVFSGTHGECYLIFEFLVVEVLKVTQIGEPFDCGFGHGVFASGIYILQDTAVPPIGCLRPEPPDDSLNCTP